MMMARKNEKSQRFYYTNPEKVISLLNASYKFS